MNRIRFFISILLILFSNNLICMETKESTIHKGERVFKTNELSLDNSNPIPFEIIEEGDIKTIQEALNNGLNVNAKYKVGYYSWLTPLAVAVSNRKGAKAEVVELLLKNNADGNGRIYNNETPLMRVSYYGCNESPKIVQILIKNGADINAQDDKGNTALHYVTHFFNQNKSEIVKLLLIYGADINIKNNAGKNFIDYTFGYDMEETRTQILKIVKEFFHSCPIPFKIIHHGDIKELEKVIEYGADVNANFKEKNYSHINPLMLAILGNSANKVKLLLEKGADVNSERAIDGKTPLTLALESECDPEIVKTLIDFNARINDQDNEGNTLLTKCILSKKINVDVIEMLLKAGANINIANKEGQSFYNFVEKPEMFDRSLQKNRIEILKIYYGRIKFNEQEFLQKAIDAIENNNFKSVLRRLQMHPEIMNKKNELGETILNQAILFARFEIIKQLFENPTIIIKPDILIGHISKIFFDDTNPVEYARKLGKPFTDPKKQIYRDIAQYLKNKRDIQQIRSLRSKNYLLID